MKNILFEWRKFITESKEEIELTQIKADSIKEAGSLIGEKLKSSISSELKSDKINKLIKKFDDWFQKGNELSKKQTPKAYEFLEGIAEGADVPVDNLFCDWYEELLYAKQKDKNKLKDEGCTDIVIKNKDNVMIGHTNDISPKYNSRLFKIEIKDEPTIFVVLTSGVPSVGINSNGIIFSGDQVDANDTRPGIPRQMLYFESLFTKSLKDAERLLLHPERASSFNNILADEEGNIINLEASATKEKRLKHEDGIFAHTNHFIYLKDKEGRTGESYTGSVKRLKNAFDRADDANEDLIVSVEEMKEILSSHEEGGLCRHSKDKENGTVTAFSIIFFPKERKFLYGDGNPCETNYKEYKY